MTTRVEPATHGADLPGGRKPRPRARAAVRATDPLTLSGLTQILTSRADVLVATHGLSEEVDVQVFATERITSDVLATMRRAAGESAAPVVLVTSELEKSALLSVVECGVVAVVHRGAATEERLVSTIGAAMEGGGALPQDLLGELLRQVRALQQEILAPRGLSSTDLTPREIDVVRLLADGRGTEEIGNQLCYSERTVKNIIHSMTSRLNLRNRPQLVAYGLRAGVI